MNLLTVKQAADILGVHPNTIRAMIQDGRLTSIQLGQRLTRIDLTQVKELLNA